MRLRVRNDDLRYEREALFERAEFRIRRNRPSTFQVDLNADQAMGLTRGVGLVFDDEFGIVLSGLILIRRRTDDSGRDRVELYGRCDMHRLQGRLAYPDPQEPADGQQPASMDRTGPAGEVLAEMVDQNAGPSARAERQIFGLTVPDAIGVGGSIRARRRFPIVSEEVRRLGRMGSVVGSVVQAPKDPEMHFEVSEVRDLTREVVFSQGRGNLAGFDIELEHPETTVAIVAGSGEGHNRMILTQEDESATLQYGRWETWVDARNETDDTDSTADQMADLEDRGDEYLGEHGAREHLAVEALETRTARWREHYRVGDLVTAEIDGARIEQTIEEAEVIVRSGAGPDGGVALVVTPVLGGESPKRRRSTLERIGEIERTVRDRGRQ